MSALGDSAYIFRLSPAELGLSLEREDPSSLYSPDAVEEIYRAVACAFSGPLYAVVEVGGGDLQTPGRGRLHLHVIAHREDGPQTIRRDTERSKPVTDPLGLYRYLAKPPEPYSLDAELDLAAARALSPTGKAPRTRRHFLGPERIAWASLHCSKNQTVRAPLHCSKNQTVSAPPSAPISPPLDQDPARATEETDQARGPRPAAPQIPDAQLPALDLSRLAPKDPARALRASRAALHPRTRALSASHAYGTPRPAPRPHTLVRIPPPPLPARIVRTLRHWVEELTGRFLLKAPVLRLGRGKPPLLDPRSFLPRDFTRLPLLADAAQLRRASAPSTGEPLSGVLSASGRPDTQNTRVFD